MTDYVLKVSRKIMAVDRPATVESEFGSIKQTMRLSDDVRWQMGGEEVAYFNATVENGQVTFFKRVPDPKWRDRDLELIY